MAAAVMAAPGQTCSLPTSAPPKYSCTDCTIISTTFVFKQSQNLNDFSSAHLVVHLFQANLCQVACGNDCSTTLWDMPPGLGPPGPARKRTGAAQDYISFLLQLLCAYISIHIYIYIYIYLFIYKHRNTNTSAAQRGSAEATQSFLRSRGAACQGPAGEGAMVAVGVEPRRGVGTGHCGTVLLVR